MKRADMHVDECAYLKPGCSRSKYALERPAAPEELSTPRRHKFELTMELPC